MLEKYLKDLIENKSYNLSGLKISKIKENDSIYLVYFEEPVESLGKQLIYKIEKKSGENSMLFLPDLDNFKLLDEFENNDFVNIPESFRGKVFK